MSAPARLSLKTLASAGAAVSRPAYDPVRLGCGIVHLGVGAFHRAHQAAFTEDAVEAAGGQWGIAGVSLRRPDIAALLAPQDNLYTLELRTPTPTYRILGVLRRTIAARLEPDAVLEAIAAPETHVVTLTVTEPGYAYGADGALDVADAEVDHDLAGGRPPRSTVGWLVEGLARRRARGGGPLTVISCDNLRSNGRKLEAAVAAFAARRGDAFRQWIGTSTAFPDTMVDAITPASDDALVARVAVATGLEDRACVQREPFAQWVIEDRCVGPRPAWERVGVEIVADVGAHEALKLHVLNAAHSALAYLGLPRGYTLVREAIGDRELSHALDAAIATEVEPVLAAQGIGAERVRSYWRGVRTRFAEPGLDHRLDQIARDGAAKLRERVQPILLANARAGRPTRRMAEVVAAWLAWESRPAAEALADPAVFDTSFRDEPRARDAVLRAARTPTLQAAS